MFSIRVLSSSVGGDVSKTTHHYVFVSRCVLVYLMWVTPCMFADVCNVFFMCVCTRIIFLCICMDAIPYAYVLVFLSCRVCRTRVRVRAQWHAGDSGSIVLAGANNNEPLCLHSQSHLVFDAIPAEDAAGVAAGAWDVKGLHRLGECLALGPQLNRLNSQLRDSHRPAHTTTPSMSAHTTTPASMSAHTTAPPELGLCMPLFHTAVSVGV